MPLLALSTSWCSHRHTDGYAMLREMADLGFDYVELSHGIRITLVPGILRAVEDKVVKVASTHNFCPLPTGVTQAAPNLFQPSSRDAREGDQWLRHTKRSLDFAAQLRAKVVVCHLGSVPFFWFHPARRLEGFIEKTPDAAENDDPKLKALVEKVSARMRKRMPPFREQMIASIRSVDDYAKSKGLRIGCENREKFEELPMDDDFGPLLEQFGPSSSTGYWHDTGHAELKRQMGLLHHRPHLEKNAERLIGFHLHDVNAEGEDHQAIGDGKIDFEMVSQFWRDPHVLVLELSPRIPVEKVTASKDRVQSLLRARGLA